MKVEITTITPTMAEEILKKSRDVFKNRRPSKRTVSLYAKDMANGSWKENGETIKLTSDGVLIDGQHRLEAINECKIPQRMIVVSDIDPSVVDTIDIGRQRSLESALEFQGTAYERGASAIIKLAMTLDRENTQIGQSCQNMGISRVDQVNEFQENESDYLNATTYARDIYKRSGKVLNSAEVGAIYIHLTKKLGWDEKYIKDFFEKLISASRGGGDIFSTTMNNLSQKNIYKGASRIREYILCFNSMLHNCKKQRQRYSDWFESN